MAKEVVIWPNYIDAQKTRREGRRIHRDKAVPAPTLREILFAAEKLGFKARQEAGKAYPREWWSTKGRVMVSKASSKEKPLRDIAAVIKKQREASSN